MRVELTVPRFGPRTTILGRPGGEGARANTLLATARNFTGEFRFCSVSRRSAILTRSSIRTTETIEWEDGNEYPVYYVDISSASHPFYTGKQQFVDTMGRVEKFRKKFGGDYQSTQKKKKKAKK